MPDVNFWLAAFAGFAGAYLLSVSGYWVEGHFGLPRFDIAESGKRYLGGDMPGWWVVGILGHFINGALLGELYAAVFFPAVAGWSDNSIILVLTGIVYGLLIWLILMNLIVLPLSGVGPFGRNTGSPKLALATLALHILFGAVLGFVYRAWH